MYVITNRYIDARKRGPNCLPNRPSSRGPNELRFVCVERKGKQLRVDLLDDQMQPSHKKEVCGDLGLEPSEPLFASSVVIHQVLKNLIKTKKDLLVFVPDGVGDASVPMETALDLEEAYGVDVLMFLWPLNGGGVVGLEGMNHVDAKTSSTALWRAIRLIQTVARRYFLFQTEPAKARATRKHPDNMPEMAEDFMAQMQKRWPFRISLMAHGLGCLLVEQILRERLYDETLSLFDNVLLVAADTDARGHETWVDRINCRGSVYITINENDAVLEAMRLGPDVRMPARLGQSGTFLFSDQSAYILFTGVPHVRAAHTYFVGDVLQKNAAVRRFFQRALRGENAERGLKFVPISRASRVGKRAALAYSAMLPKDETWRTSTSRISLHRACFFAFEYDSDANILLMHTIQEILLKNGFGTEVLAPIKGMTTTDILADIDAQLHAAHFGIVEITGKNPNVLIETGILRGLDKPVVPIFDRDAGGPLPFNIGNIKAIGYRKETTKNGDLRFIGLEKELTSSVRTILGVSAAFRNAALWTTQD